MPKRIVIVGGGGFGSEVLQWLRDSMSYSPDAYAHNPQILVLDDSISELVRPDMRSLFAGPVRNFSAAPGDKLLIALGDPEVRKDVVRQIEASGNGKNLEYLTLVHPSARVVPHVQFGHGLIVCPNALVSTNVTIGDHVHINVGTTIGHDAKIGSFSTISSQCDVTGGVELGEGTFMGSGARVLPGCKLAAWSRIGAGTVVSRSSTTRNTYFTAGTKKIVVD